MVGGGNNRKDDGVPAISSTNIFAALERKRSKSSSRKKLEREKSKGKPSEGDDAKAAEEPAQFWSATQVSVKSWADCDDEDDYYATTAPPADHGVEAAAATEEQKEVVSQGEVRVLGEPFLSGNRLRMKRGSCLHDNRGTCGNIGRGDNSAVVAFT